jgi:lysosomal Pro-X carboxypeptidase
MVPLALLLMSTSSFGMRTFLPRLPATDASTPGTANCSTKWHSQYIDHFSQSQGSKKYQQRYFVNADAWQKGGPIFFYVGNEANVELYVNATGLMWENAEAFGAMLVFAEHRYWGLSQPFGIQQTDKSYLTPEQAMADFATLVYDMKNELDTHSSPVIAFGGSYGGDLAAWSRMKYPTTFQGAIAASAPVLGFLGELPEWDSNLYFQVITRNAGVKGGSPASCATNIQKAISLLDSYSDHGALQKAFHLCEPPATAFQVLLNAFWVMPHPRINSRAPTSRASSDRAFPSSFHW